LLLATCYTAFGVTGRCARTLPADLGTYRLGAYATADRALEALVQRGLVDRTGRTATIVPDVFLRMWLQSEPVTSVSSLT
jgi:hypothetical protein